jgi:hypothetical protein
MTLPRIAESTTSARRVPRVSRQTGMGVGEESGIGEAVNVGARVEVKIGIGEGTNEGVGIGD